MFSLVSNRYERASMIVTSNKPFSAWGEIFGDDMAATAMIDRLIRHSEILSLKGDSYRLRGKDLDARPAPDAPKPADRSPSGTSPRAQNAAQRAESRDQPVQPGLKRPSPLRPRYGLGLRDDGRSASETLRRAGSQTLKWPSFRPAPNHRVGHFSIGAGGTLFDRS